MSQNAVLKSQDGPPQPPRPTTGEVLPQIDPVRSLSESVHRFADQAGNVSDWHRRRGFDAQYWACWVMALVYPLLLAYLLLTR
jgi:hypothetical protein